VRCPDLSLSRRYRTSPDKQAVLSEAFRVLKPGGEMYFSDGMRISKNGHKKMDMLVGFGDGVSLAKC
jgi:ubiquinone/menaquinone biosynthesis C-methylase UbiE